ncbi:MAG: hypothetical protein JW759_07130 [Candidatus Coatesbacteria bacterium]|nr:hypothetical protein [Candidatus Coatesbacteria bacterium]
MKELKLIISSLLFLLCASLSVCGEGVTVRLEFPQESVAVSEMGEYDLVSVEGCELFGKPGEPLLPTKAVYVSLPLGFEMTDVCISENKQIQLPGAFNIAPAQPVQPVSQPDLCDFVPPEPCSYSLSGAQPAQQLTSTGIGSLRGFRILGLIVYPIQYVASERRLLLSTHMTIEVAGEQIPSKLGTQPESTLAGDVAAKSLVGSLVENPEGAVQEPGTAPLYWRDKCDVLIITQAYFVPSFEDLRDWYYRKGYRTEIVTIDTIAGGYAGGDLPAKIRNCIKDYYINQGLGWVILGGDAAEVPTRTAFAFIVGDEYDLEDYQQCDFYYSDLDGSWNADGDEYWGEYIEDDIDMYPDVFVGRLPASSLSNARLLVQKALTYEGAGDEAVPTDYLTRALFWACKLDDRPTWGGDAKDSITEATIFPGYWTFKACYDRDKTSGKANILAAMNDGYAIVNNCGHSNFTVAGALYDAPEDEREYIMRNDMSGLKNGPRYSVLYSIGCMFGALDSDSLASRFMIASRGGGVAAIANSRYGWYSSGSAGNGPSDRMDREFFDALFKSRKYNVGEALAESKARYIAYSKRAMGGWYGCFRWITYGMNLFGSPVTPVWTATPSTILVRYDPVLRLNREDFFATVTDKQGAPIKGALVCLTDGEGWLGRGTTDEYGEVLVDTPHVESNHDFDLTVTAQNFLPRTYKVRGIFNTDLELNGADVDPPYGRPGGAFTFRVHYYDEDGDAPLVIRANVAGQYFHMSLLEGEPADGIYGVQLVVGTGDCMGQEYHFFAVDGRGSFKRYPPTGELYGAGIDDVSPTSRVRSPKYSTSATVAVTYSAEDDCSGIDDVALWFRVDKGAWRASGLLGQGSSGTIHFGASDEGTYDFFSIAADNAGNEQTRIARVDATCVYDATPPSSFARCSPTSIGRTLSIPCSAIDSLAGVDRVRLLYRFLGARKDTPESSAEHAWQTFEDVPWRQGVNFEFEAQFGPGLYEFITRATDRAGNRERVKEVADASCTFTSDLLDLRLWTNAERYSRGEELVLSALYQNYGDALMADLFAAIVFSDGQVLFLPAVSEAIAPFYTAMEIPASSSRDLELLRLTVPQGISPGRYEFWAVFAHCTTGELVSNVATAGWELF